MSQVLVSCMHVSTSILIRFWKGVGVCPVTSAFRDSFQGLSITQEHPELGNSERRSSPLFSKLTMSLMFLGLAIRTHLCEWDKGSFACKCSDWVGDILLYLLWAGQCCSSRVKRPPCKGCMTCVWLFKKQASLF